MLALLLGADLKKSVAVLEAAYDDALGVTAAFNLNVLNHVNRIIDADFKVQDWTHVGRFDEALSRIEMYVQARHDVCVRWPDGERRFVRGERIHTENSYKYRPEAFDALLAEAGFATRRFWTDDRGWFGVYFAQPD